MTAAAARFDELRRAALAATAPSSSLSGAVQKFQASVFHGTSGSAPAASTRGSAPEASSPGAPTAASVIRNLISMLPGYAEGGRVSGPVISGLAEHGVPEYIMPDRDRGHTLPLIRDLITELAATRTDNIIPSAAAFQESASAPSPANPTETPYRAPAAASPAAPIQITVNAPCTFNVSIPDTDPHAVGEAICETAERTLARALGSALCTALEPALSGYPL